MPQVMGSQGQARSRSARLAADWLDEPDRLDLGGSGLFKAQKLFGLGKNPGHLESSHGERQARRLLRSVEN